jgi:hypothetical protein
MAGVVIQARNDQTGFTRSAVSKTISAVTASTIFFPGRTRLPRNTMAFKR